MEYAFFSRIIIAFALSAVRVGTAFAICPALSDSMITGIARRCAIVAFAIPVVPGAIAALPPEGLAWPLLCMVVAKEAVVGAILGFFASIPFWIAENVGNLIDNQRGATMGEVYSPLSGTQVSTTGIFFTQITSTIFFVSGAFLLFLAALYRSYQIIPLLAGLPLPALAGDAPAQLLGTLDGMLQATVVISAPVIILMFLATLGLGFVNRTAPQLNVFFLSMPVKSALGVWMLMLYLRFIMDKLMYTDSGAILSPFSKLFS